MRSRWSDEQAAATIAELRHRHPRCNEDVALRVYTSRLIGSEPTLVLHGGGNTSVKTTAFDELGRAVEVLCVKGSGWDLASLAPAGLPAVRLGPLGELRSLPSMTDEQMVNAIRTRLLDASAPNPSVETLLHAFLPHKYIDHSHADAILAVVDQHDGEALCRAVFGGRLAIVPYVMPGFALAKLAAEIFEADPAVEGMLLLQHGLFTFGDDARTSYERHIAAVTIAEQWAATRGDWRQQDAASPSEVTWTRIAPILRGRVGESGRASILRLRTSPEIRRFVDDVAVLDLTGRGPATPDHVIRTKRLPLVLEIPPDMDDEALTSLVGDAVERYRAEYRAYVARQSASKGRVVVALDPDPRVVLVPGLGIVAIGTSRKAAEIAADLYEHTVAIIRAAEAIGRYRALPEDDIFDMEYWSLEQAKLGKTRDRPLEARVVYVTGAARGIGEAIARVFSAAGAHLHLVDCNAEPLAEVAGELSASFTVADVGDRQAVLSSIEEAVAEYGGLDGIVSNAGIAPQSPIFDCPPELLEDSLRVNLLAHQYVAAAATEVMRRQGSGGFLLFNASKSAFNPGVGFGPYAVAKAALVALVKQYALEGAPFGIRSNAINADRVRTNLLSVTDIDARARARGLESAAYWRSNLLGREVSVGDVAQAFLFMALAESTTAAVLPVDGGNIAASPR